MVSSPLDHSVSGSPVADPSTPRTFRSLWVSRSRIGSSSVELPLSGTRSLGGDQGGRRIVALKAASPQSLPGNRADRLTSAYSAAAPAKCYGSTWILRRLDSPRLRSGSRLTRPGPGRRRHPKGERTMIITRVVRGAIALSGPLWLTPSRPRQFWVLHVLVEPSLRGRP